VRTSKLIYLVVFLVLRSPTQCFSESEVLSHSLDLGGAVEDADISPSGDYTAAAVRKCALSDGDRTCPLDIEIWSTGDTKRLARRTLLPNVRDVAVVIRFSADGHMLVISDGQGKLRLWHISDLIESSSFDLGLTDEDVQDLLEKQEKEYVRRFGQCPKVRSIPRIAQIEISPTSLLVGVVVRVGGAEIIRVFDLTSGKLLQSWSFMDAASYKGAPALSWSQDGKRIAISLPGTRGLKHPERTDPADLLIYDAISGQLSAKFEVREDWERSLAAPGRAIFAGDNLIVSTHRMPDTFFRPTLRVLDSRTGEKTRKISAEGTGVRDPIAVSGDGKELLGFVGRARKEMIWSDLTTINVAVDTRIGLWDIPTGKQILASGNLPLIPGRASFRLNTRGNWIIGFDQGTKLLVLQLK
jgi:WD40 repeat protein